MTKTDFVAIQGAIRDARMAATDGGLTTPPFDLVHRIFNSMAKDIASVLSKQNPKFKRAEFLRGCGVE